MRTVRSGTSIIGSAVTHDAATEKATRHGGEGSSESRKTAAAARLLRRRAERVPEQAAIRRSDDFMTELDKARAMPFGRVYHGGGDIQSVWNVYLLAFLSEGEFERCEIWIFVELFPKSFYGLCFWFV